MSGISDRLYGHNRLYAAWNGWRWTGWYLRRGRGLAAIRQAWSAYVRGDIGEACQECGRSYPVWHAADDLYGRVTGRWPTPWSDGSGRAQAASGLFCIACFDRLARLHGIALKWLPDEQVHYRTSAEHAP